MSTFKPILPQNVAFDKTQLVQLIDILQQDISGSSTRKKYQVFVTGGVGPGVTSSLFQTIYDQDFTLQTANAVMDLTVGLWPSGTVVASASLGTDSAGKELFPSQSLMMREKMDVYRQFAQHLLGDSTEAFTVPYSGGTEIDVAMFMPFKRLFARDGVKPGTFAMKFYPSASIAAGHNMSASVVDSSFKIYADVNGQNSIQFAPGGRVSNIVDSAATSNNVGLMFYDAGVAVFDLKKITSSSQDIFGTINSMSTAGTQVMSASLVPNFMTSGSLDNIIDHLAYTRFQSGSLTAVTFQNVTNINSTLIFCNAASDEFNYSSNPTYVDDTGQISVIDDPNDTAQKSFTYITTIGLYDAAGNLLAVAKLSRPVEKSVGRDLTFRVRLDF